MELVTALKVFLGELLVQGGGAAAIAYALYMFFGRSYIDSRFESKLEKQRQSQREDLEHLRNDLQASLAKSSTIHQLELDVLPEMWKRLQRAIQALSEFASLFKAAGHFDDLSQEDLERKLGRSKLSDEEKDEIRMAGKKEEKYQEIVFRKEYASARSSFFHYHSYMEAKSVFLESELQLLFEEAGDLVWTALNEQEVGKTMNDRKLVIDSYKKIKDKIYPVRTKIKEGVQRRIRLEI